MDEAKDMDREQALARITAAMCAWDAGDPHRIQHFLKVHSLARQIALTEDLPAETRWILEIAALTHDIGVRAAIRRYGWQNARLQQEMGPDAARLLLAPMGLPQAVTERVCFLIAHHHTYAGVDAPDWQILLEADYLVNMAEKGWSAQAAAEAETRFFRTAAGKTLLRQLQPDPAACTTRPEQRRPDGC